jgi:hypothetical protein
MEVGWIMHSITSWQEISLNTRVIIPTPQKTANAHIKQLRAKETSYLIRTSRPTITLLSKLLLILGQWLLQFKPTNMPSRLTLPESLLLMNVELTLITEFWLSAMVMILILETTTLSSRIHGAQLGETTGMSRFLRPTTLAVFSPIQHSHKRLLSFEVNT